ncbi:MAG TPA: ABC transporter substrate-binding protein [Candidatus Sulfotelmatobacter sp.]|nr:ABC transporter substrate-binding protein [Candidatus Sulfotelmatobacter sp.]
MKRIKHAVGTFVAATALALGAGTAHAQFSHNVVKIGVMTDLAGVYADLSGKGAVEAVKMAVADFGGKVKGIPVEVLVADHQNKPDIASTIARQWFDVDNVDMITDLVTSSTALAVQQVAREKNKIDIVVTAAASDLTGKQCSPTGIHYAYDTYALAKGTGGAMVSTGGDSWFFITVDYAFGLALERDTTDFVKRAGGKVLGSVKHPLGTTDFSSYLLQAQGSKAKVIGFANAGQDTINSIKQAVEFGIPKGGQKLAGLLIFDSDIHSLGLPTAQGLVLTTGWYWDLNDETRAFGKRFYEKLHAMPTMTQAGDYSATMHYLKAVDAAGTDDPEKVMAKMREMPVNDFFAKNGKIRVDGTMTHDMYLVEVKKPEESKYPWDYFKVLKTIPGDEAFRPLSESECPLVKKS